MASLSRRLEQVLASAWVLAGVACAPVAGTPRATLSSLERAVAQRDAEAVWRLLSPAAQAQVSREELARALAASGPESEEARELAAVLASASKAPVTAQVGAEERRLDLVWLDDEKRWAFRASPLAAFDLSTPRGALWALLRAVERGRWDVVLSLAPAARRRALTLEELRAFWTGRDSAALRALFPALRAALRASGEHPVLDLGLEAHFPFSQHAEAFLVKEEGLWRVEEIDTTQ